MGTVSLVVVTSVNGGMSMRRWVGVGMSETKWIVCSELMAFYFIEQQESAAWTTKEVDRVRVKTC